jgi:3-deoxy-D-manno-octulosonate 8-phosphate phosphatase (KDO 8-P phosphatase)
MNKFMDVLAQFQKIRTFVLDVDGVLTDGSIQLLPNGEQSRTMSIRDGYALQLAIKMGYRIVIITGGRSESVVSRLKGLGITDIYIGVRDKIDCLENYVLEQDLIWEEILYMGDDIPDYGAMQRCGLATCPADAAPEIKQISHYSSAIKGGHGCVRDIIEKVMKLNEHWQLDDTVASR